MTSILGVHNDRTSKLLRVMRIDGGSPPDETHDPIVGDDLWLTYNQAWNMARILRRSCERLNPEDWK